MNYTVLQLRGGTSSEHLSGNGTGFVGKAKEVTVDTTEWTLRVHDGNKIGGYKLALANNDIEAKYIKFEDGESLQYKLDSGKLGSSSEIIPPQTPIVGEHKILTVSPTNMLSNGTCDITYYLEFATDTQNTVEHYFSKDNGNTFQKVTPSGFNPYTIKVKNLIMGSNICAIKLIIDGKEVVKYFITEIPNPSEDTSPVIDTLYTSNITSSGFTLNYKVTDRENHVIRNHQISLDNGYSYREFYPTLKDDLYSLVLEGLNNGTTYFCRVKVNANGLESNPYGFQVTTSNINSIYNPILTDGNNVYKLKVENGTIVTEKCNDNTDKAQSEIILNDEEKNFKISIKNNVLNIVEI